MSWYHPQDIQMHSYTNGTSISTKLGNWQQLERMFCKHGLCFPQEEIEGTVHCKPGAAASLITRLYTLLTHRMYAMIVYVNVCIPLIAPNVLLEALCTPACDKKFSLLYSVYLVLCQLFRPLMLQMGDTCLSLLTGSVVSHQKMCPTILVTVPTSLSYHYMQDLLQLRYSGVQCLYI